MPRRDASPPDPAPEEGDAHGGQARRSTVQSVSRAFEILEILKDSPASMSALEIAREADLDRTVVHRLLRTLAQHGMAIEDNGTFRLGPETVLLGNCYVDNLLVRRMAMPHMLDVQANAVGEKPWTVSLSIAVRDVTTVIERVWTRAAPLATVLEIGDVFPIDRSAAGRCILAFQADDEIKALIGTERSEQVAPLLARARDAGGVALARGEASPGVYAVAAAILSRRGSPVAALAVSGLDLGDEVADNSALADHLRRAARAIGQSVP